jgi:hypothetical protein
MSDPFDRLRNARSTATPDLPAIKARARRITRRRRVVLSSTAAAIAAVAVAGVVLRTGPTPRPRPLAQANVTRSARAERFAATATAVPEPPNQIPTTALGLDKSAQGTVSSTAAPARQPGGAAAAPAPAPEQGSGTLALQVSAKAAGPHSEQFTLTACNPASSSVAVTFPTGQRYDFEVRRSGSLVWRWSDGMAFTMIYGRETWAPKQCKSYSATWDGTNSSHAPVATGAYDVTGILASSPRESTAPKSFCLDVC